MDDPDFVERSKSRPFALPPRPRTSPVAFTVGILVILALLVGGGVTIVKLMPASPAPVPARIAPAPVVQVNPSVKPRPGPVPPVRPSQQKPVIERTAVEPARASVVAPRDPASEDWERIEETYRTEAPELAIVALTDFLNRAPGSTFTMTAQAQIDEALDRLWWRRIQSLCTERDEFQKQMTAIDKQIGTVRANGAVASRIRELQSQRDPIAAQLESVQSQLDEMKYSGPVVPDVYDEGQLAKLRSARDTTTFETWKKRVRSYITRNRGKLPW